MQHAAAHLRLAAAHVPRRRQRICLQPQNLLYLRQIVRQHKFPAALKERAAHRRRLLHRLCARGQFLFLVRFCFHVGLLCSLAVFFYCIVCVLPDEHAKKAERIALRFSFRLYFAFFSADCSAAFFADAFFAAGFFSAGFLAAAARFARGLCRVANAVTWSMLP